MKTGTLNCTTFSHEMNRAAAGNETKTTPGFLKALKVPSTLFLLLGVILLGTSSCSRSMSSGCGTWPTVNKGKYPYHQSSSSNWTLKTKNNKQFANYKGFN